MARRFTKILMSVLLLAGLTVPTANIHEAEAGTLSSVVINEIAWMGTTSSYNDEWIELYNHSDQDIDLTGWTLSSEDGSPSIELSGILPAKEYYILERTDDNTLPDVTADLIFSGNLSNSGEVLNLNDASLNIVDSVDAWHAGDNTSKASMERIDPEISGTNSTNWYTSDQQFANGLGTPGTRNSKSKNLREIVINELAWMGTTASYSDEWIELHNNSGKDIPLDGWKLSSADGSPSIALSGIIPAHGYFLLEKTDDNSVAGIPADIIYSGSLGNSGEDLSLEDKNGVPIDEVDTWYAGINDEKATMERTNSNENGMLSTNWASATADYAVGFGTPKAFNSTSSDGSGTIDETAPDSPPATTGNICNDSSEHLNNVTDTEGSINVYFNKCALTEYASLANEANYNVNLEDRLNKRLNEAKSSIDLATYEINLPGIVDTLIERAAAGIDVRVIADAKEADDPHYAERFETMRLNLEKMVRGKDLVIGTDDDIVVISDSPMFAVEDAAKRGSFELPSSPADFPAVTVNVGSSSVTGFLFVDGEQKSADSYFSPGNQMHNKFAIIDDRWVFTGSWNFTVTGLYGSEENMQQGILDGNQQHVVEVNWPQLAGIYETEFNEMWGSNTMTPDLTVSNFSTRKADNTTKVIDINGKKVEIYFSSGDNAIGRMTELVKNEADVNTYFSIFAWSDQALVDELKYKWEGSYNDSEGTLTGFDIKGLFDSSFWTQWWSASVDMTGTTTATTSVNNPNTRWATPAPVYQDGESRKLHSKTMIIDADTSSDPTVIVGSTNWSNNGNNVNDENMLIIHDDQITNQFLQEFNARYSQAGGTIN